MKTAGLILAGGRSRRMAGHHKGALLTGEGLTFTEHIVKEMRRLTDCIYISYGDTAYAEIPGCSLVRDIFPDCGPLGGLHAALKAAEADGAMAVMTAACDMPFLRAELYNYLLDQLISRTGLSEYIRQDDAAYPGAECGNARVSRVFAEFDGVAATLGERIHPLAAVYSVNAAAVFEERLTSGSLKLLDALGHLRILYVDLLGTGLEQMLVNINTENEYAALVGHYI